VSKTDDILDFHRVTDSYIGEKPVFPPDDVVELRKRLVQEEYLEFVDAVLARDLTETADALVDLTVVVIGTAISFGIPFDEVWDEIHESNMAKVDPKTGKVKKRVDGKVLKPKGWKPPDVAAILKRRAYNDDEINWTKLVQYLDADYGGTRDEAAAYWSVHVGISPSTWRRWCRGEGQPGEVARASLRGIVEAPESGFEMASFTRTPIPFG